MDYEDKRTRNREACRKWASKNDRTDYFIEYEKRRSRSKEAIMFNNSKLNARKKNLEHTIVLEDIVVTDTCPCCKTVMVQPSLDRVDNNKGYIKSNIQVICWMCNKIKNVGDSFRHRQIADYIDAFFP